MAQPTPETQAARRRLRALRLGLSPDERTSAEQAIASAIRRMNLLRRGNRVAVYLPMPGEVGAASLLASAWRAGCHVYVPRITDRRRGRMVFVPLRTDSRFRPNVFGIAEPVAPPGTRVRPLDLDVVLMPVVGFDRRGNRLGMGAGYYDRALRHRHDGSRSWRRPRLVGLAFACQEVADIVPSHWDVALDLVVTEREVIVPGRTAVPAERSTA
jgi:5-formyltetrahydrofolate cyclo-ligase